MMITVNNTEECAQNKVRFVCISDTHGKINFEVPDGHVLIHAGDISRKSTMVEFEETIRWLSTLPHQIKIITGGNHDHYLDSVFGFVEKRQTLLALMEQHNLIYLEHEPFQLPKHLGSHTLFVSPYAPMHLGGAFMLENMSEIWNQVPAVDILVTHTPPFGHGDKIIRGGRRVGCTFLRKQIDQVIRPKVSISGHIHEAHGYEFEGDRLYINACLCDHRYRGNQSPITFDL